MVGTTFRTGVRRGLDRTVYESWQSATRAAGHPAGSLLAWQRTADGQYCLASIAALSISSGVDDQRRWQQLRWHRIEHGSFDADTSTLHWTYYADTDTQPPDPAEDAVGGELMLDGPGRVPMIFKDRVAASITVRQFVPLGDAEAPKRREDRRPGVIVSGRRDPSSASNRIEWRVSLARRTTWQTPGIADLAAVALTRIRADFDPEG